MTQSVESTVIERRYTTCFPGGGIIRTVQGQDPISLKRQIGEMLDLPNRGADSILQYQSNLYVTA
jgi:hypothetical protein